MGSHHKVEDYGDHSSDAYYEWLKGIYSVYEGREWVVGLRVPVDFSFSAWQINFRPWDVQRTRNGELVVVDWMARYQSHLPRDENGFEVTLDEFRRAAKRLHAEYLASHGGRTGDFDGAPLILNDANHEFLLTHMSHGPVFSVFDGTPEPPPTAPGEGNPYTPGQNIGDPTLTASPEVPGGLEGTPTPVSSLGDEPMAAATTERD